MGLRVALIAPFGLQPKGTTSARVLPIARVLAHQGADVRVVVPPWDDRRQSGSQFVDQGVDVVHTRVAPGLSAFPVIMTEIRALVDEWRPDVIHAFKPIGYSGAAALWYRWAARDRPVVVDADDLEGLGGWASRKRQGWNGRLRGIQERTVLRGASAVTVASAWLERYVRGLGVPTERILQVPNGHEPIANLPMPGREQEPATDNLDPRLLWYTRFTEASPQRAATLLAPLISGPNSPRLAVLGEDVNTGDREALASAFATAGVPDRVDWLGYDPDILDHVVRRHAGNLIAVYPLDDDLVNRARCPSKVPHLMALGIPVAAEAVGEVARYLAGFEAECLVAPGDSNAFQDRVRVLLDGPESRGHLAVRLQTAAARFTWQHTAEALLPWYQRYNCRNC